jgi:hypothetical protein
MRTPKVGETWIWNPCDAHGYRQLRDVVEVGRNFEDQPNFIQDEIMEHLICGCQYASDDPEAAIRDLRQYEEQEKKEFLKKFESIESTPEVEGDPSWLVPIVLFVIAVLMFLVLHR